jgi:small nuclear ribonucleoprotein B and B'
MSKTGKMQQWINYKIRVTVQDRRDIIGQFMAFDKHMNLILGDAEEFRRVGGKGKGKEEKIQKRTLGLVLLRGENIVSLSVEGPPPPEVRLLLRFTPLFSVCCHYIFYEMCVINDLTCAFFDCTDRKTETDRPPSSLLVLVLVEPLVVVSPCLLAPRTFFLCYFYCDAF